MELHHGSFLMITELRKSKNGHSVTFDGYLFPPVNLEQYLSATYGVTKVVWLCKAKEHDPKPEGYLGSASSKDVLRIRHLVVIRSNYVAEFPLQTQAVGKLKDTTPPICQWMSVAELSKSRGAKNPISCPSIEKNKGSQGLSKAFIALSSEESFPGGIATADIFYLQHHLAQLEATSYVGSCQTNRHELPQGRNPERGKDRCGDVLAPITSGNSIAKATCNSARPSYHLACHMLRTSSAQPKVLEHDFEPSHYTFADAFCGAGGTSVGARDAGLHIKWAFDYDGDAIDTYVLNHAQDTCLRAEKFLEEAGFACKESYVNVLHQSSPRSEANNNKCVTSVDTIVEKVKPRIVTFEKVPQVLFRHREYFTTLARNLTSIGYNIRWRTLECVNFGVPQKRMRPFMVASCLGEPLPDFPESTHGHLAHCEQLRLQPWNSFGGAIDNLEDGDPNYLQGHRRKN
ncbi:S-adenosyl-L-methionine-dependent methyltransferase [Usnea florida]